MNLELFKVLREYDKNNEFTKGDLAENCFLSLEKTDQLISSLLEEGLLKSVENGYAVTEAGQNLLEEHRVDNAIILAAGFGSRFVPVTYEKPKGFVEVFGERMIERQIKQLLEAEVTDITVVVGYMKEKFEYLIDKYGVKLVYNEEYNTKNNLATVYHVRHLLKNTYILTSDNYFTKNLYNKYEFNAWYSSVKAEGYTPEWCLKINGNGRIIDCEVGGSDMWYMYGSVFFSQNFSDTLVPLLEKAYFTPGTEDHYWEHVFADNLEALEMYINPQGSNVVYEFESLEELREFDPSYRENSNSEIMSLLSFIFNVKEDAIREIKPIKTGMTNKSFRFSVNDKEYVCRIPAEGVEMLINRNEEYQSIQGVQPLKITENIVYFDPKTGIKVSEYETGSRSVDKHNEVELRKSMSLLRELHTSGLVVPHHFDLEKEIVFYEDLCKRNDALLFEDFSDVRAKMDELLTFLRGMDLPSVFCHIDAHVDNILVLPNGDLKLIDWEYAGMCDPVIDIAMFALYSNFNHEELEQLMDYYFENGPTEEERLRIYMYMSLSGFLWSMWALYKQALGVKFGDYTLNMYRYAKDYYSKSLELMGELQYESTK